MALVIPWTFANAGVNTPTNRLDADFNAIRDYVNTRNPTVGPIGSRPAAGNAGSIWIASDQSFRAYYDNGSAWQTFDYTSIPGASFFTFASIATPTTPSAGKALLYISSGPSGLPQPAWLNNSGIEQFLPSRYFREVGNPIKDVVNTVTETSLFTTAPNIVGGTLGADRGLRIRGFMDYLNNSGAGRNLTLRIKLGATTCLTLAAFGAVLDNTATRYGFQFEALIVAVGLTNTQVAWARGTWGDVLTGDAGVTGGAYGTTSFRPNSSAHNALTIDSTVNQTLDITAQHDNANANQSVRPYLLSVELI